MIDVMQHTGLVGALLKRMRIPRQWRDDCRQAGMLGLVEAARTYKPKRGKFSTWAWPRVRYEIDRAAKRCRLAGDVPSDALGNVPAHDPPPVDDAHAFRAMLRHTSERERATLMQRAGLLHGRRKWTQARLMRAMGWRVKAELYDTLREAQARCVAALA